MTRLSAPKVRFDSGVFIVELGEDYSHLQGIVVDDLSLLNQLAESIEPARMVIDMTTVQFIGSAVIGLFVKLSKTLKRREGTFSLLNANKYCQTVISMAKLKTLVPNCDSVRQIADLL